MAGTKQTITWEYAGNPGSKVKIELLKAGSVVTTIKSSYSAGKKGKGSFTWTVPANQPAGIDYSIRVASRTKGEYADTSDGNFAVLAPVITITSPNGGEIWQAGKAQVIAWDFQCNPGPSVKIELLKGTSTSVIKAKASIGKNGRSSCKWTISRKQGAGTDYLVRVTSVSTKTCTDISDGAFTINAYVKAQSSAGPDQNAGELTSVALSGSNSVGIEKGCTAFRWTQTDGPPVEISNRAALVTSFTAPEAGALGTSLRFELAAVDKDGSQSKDSCIVNVVRDNEPPRAVAGLNQIVSGSEVVTLDGSNSSDPDDGISSYLWKQVSGSPVSILSSSDMKPTFAAPDAGPAGESLIFELTVTDHGGLKSRDSCIVNVRSANEPPVAVADADRTAKPGAKISLDGSRSHDPEAGIASYRWRQTSGKPVTLSDPTAVKPTFVAPRDVDRSELLTFELTVTNTVGLSHRDKVSVGIVPAGADAITER